MKLKSKVKFINKEKSLFFPTLRQRVDAYFKENNLSRNANSTMVLKSIILISGYILPFVALVLFQPTFGASLLLWAIMGICGAGIGMSVMHDANHGAYSSNATINYLMGHSLNLAGGSVYNWHLQHNILHHTYTNIVPIDEDIQDRLVLKFSPHTQAKSHHKFQFIYAFFFYGLLSLYWVLAKDFVQFVKFIKTGVNPNTKKENLVTLLKIVVIKVFYFTVFVCLPIYIGIPVYQVLLGFLLTHFVEGLILTVVFQLAHTVEGTTHPQPNEHGTIENDWAIHQMNTTVNFSRKSKWISWYVGGLNFQIEHHLFPRICHVHYPNLAPIVKQTAEEFNIPYMENETFGEALLSHISALRRFGKLPDINEAIA